MIYMDNAATTPVDPEALDAMIPYMTYYYGNPSSNYKLGLEAKNKIEECRETIAKIINAEPEEIIFTSGGTEADNLALNCKMVSVKITDAIEHHAVLNRMEHFFADIIGVTQDGFIDLDQLKKEIKGRNGHKIGSFMLINNEIGTIQPIKEIVEIVKDQDMIVHTDAVQAVGHIPIDVKDLGVDMLSASAHKFGGPKGVGFLYKKKEIKLFPIMQGGGQERGLRPSTENVPGIVGMAKALEVAAINMDARYEKLEKLSKRLISGIIKNIPDSYLNGSRENRYPGNVNMRFIGVHGEQLLELLNQIDVYVSSGSACNSGSNKPSHVLKAIGLTDSEANSSIRFSLSHQNTIEEVDKVVEDLKGFVNLLRRV